MAFLRDPKRLLALLLAGVAGIVVLLDSVELIPAVAGLAGIMIGWAALLTALALLVGLLSVVGGHIQRVSKRSSDWGYSLILLLAMLTVIVFGTLIGPGTNAAGESALVMFPQSLAEQPVRYIFQFVYQPLAGAFLALLAFFSLSAALRAVQRRTRDALVIIAVALAVLIASVAPPGLLPWYNESVQWVTDYLALAGARALLIGTALGAIVASIRVLLGFDQPYLDR